MVCLAEHQMGIEREFYRCIAGRNLQPDIWQVLLIAGLKAQEF